MAAAPWHVASHDGPRTHALIVAASAYQHLPGPEAQPDPNTFNLRGLRSPVAGAIAFARWLIDSYTNPHAPLGSVWLFLSPSDDERALLEKLPNSDSIQTATSANVQAAVHAFAAAAQDPAHQVIVYLAGHGVIITQDESVVLLEDFAAEPMNKFQGAIDVAAVRGAFSHHEMAQRQLWLVDACSIRPREVGQTTFQAGVRLDAALDRAPESSVLLTGAAPHSHAFGAPGQCTLFSKAVIDSFQVYGASADEHGQWGVTAQQLSVAVSRRVAELARQHGSPQTAYWAGFGADQVIHVLDAPPSIEVTFTVTPDDAAGRCWLTVQDGDIEAIGETCMHPTVTTTVPAGLYIANVQIKPPTPPLQDRMIPFQATPPPPRMIRVNVS